MAHDVDSSTVYDIRISGGVIVSSSRLQLGDILISNGVIAAVESVNCGKPAKQVIDASGKYVLPGLIESHLHPVYADRLKTMSQSAVYGGITTLIPYIGALKAWGVEGNLWDAVNYFIEEGLRDSVVDFSLHCTLAAADIQGLEELVPKICGLGVRSFKGFMAYRKRGMYLNDTDILRTLAVLKDNQALMCVHAENGDLCDFLEDGFIAEGRVSPEYHTLSRPSIAEAEGIFRILSFAKVMNCPIYVVHVSSKESLDVINLYRSWDAPPIFVETCTHYLTLTNEEMLKRGTLAKVTPPLRTRADINALWRAIEVGSIDVIGSDAGGLMIKSKEPRFGDIFKAPGGIPGQETTFTVAFDEGYNRQGIGMCRIVEMMSERPAKIFGLYPRKGRLEAGSDADVVIFDAMKEQMVDATTQHVNTDYTMYEGRRVLGVPEVVIQRGEILLEDGELKAKSGRAEFLPANPDFLRSDFV